MHLYPIYRDSATYSLSVILFVAVLVASGVGILLEVLAEDANLRLRVTGVLLIALVCLGSSHGRSHQAGSDKLKK